MGARHRSLRHAYLPPQEVGFVTADFSKEHALEVIAVGAASTITNYTASMRKPPVEESFLPYSWND
jgi:hypothetical protein